MNYLIAYLLLINALGLLLMLIDKVKARKNSFRISEKALMGTAILGGSLGSMLGMYVCHHKTKKPKFRRGLPILFLLHTVIFVEIIIYWLKK